MGVKNYNEPLFASGGDFLVYIVIFAAVLTAAVIYAQVRTKFVRRCARKTEAEQLPASFTVACRWQEWVRLAVFVAFLAASLVAVGNWFDQGMLMSLLHMGIFGIMFFLAGGIFLTNLQYIKVQSGLVLLRGKRFNTAVFTPEQLALVRFFRRRSYRGFGYYNPTIEVFVESNKKYIGNLDIALEDYIMLRKFCLKHCVPLQDDFAGDFGLD